MCARPQVPGRYRSRPKRRVRARRRARVHWPMDGSSGCWRAADCRIIHRWKACKFVRPTARRCRPLGRHATASRSVCWQQVHSLLQQKNPSFPDRGVRWGSAPGRMLSAPWEYRKRGAVRDERLPAMVARRSVVPPARPQGVYSLKSVHVAYVLRRTYLQSEVCLEPAWDATGASQSNVRFSCTVIEWKSSRKTFSATGYACGQGASIHIQLIKLYEIKQ